MAWKAKHLDIDLADAGYQDVVVTGVVNMPAPLVRETMGIMAQVADPDNVEDLADLMPRYYKLLSLWFVQVVHGDEVTLLDTPEDIERFEEDGDWVVLGLALNRLLRERGKRREEAKKGSSTA